MKWVLVRILIFSFFFSRYYFFNFSLPPFVLNVIAAGTHTDTTLSAQPSHPPPLSPTARSGPTTLPFQCHSILIKYQYFFKGLNNVDENLHQHIYSMLVFLYIHTYYVRYRYIRGTLYAYSFMLLPRNWKFNQSYWKLEFPSLQNISSKSNIYPNFTSRCILWKMGWVPDRISFVSGIHCEQTAIIYCPPIPRIKFKFQFLIILRSSIFNWAFIGCHLNMYLSLLANNNVVSDVNWVFDANICGGNSGLLVTSTIAFALNDNSAKKTTKKVQSITSQNKTPKCEGIGNKKPFDK